MTITSDITPSRLEIGRLYWIREKSIQTKAEYIGRDREFKTFYFRIPNKRVLEDAIILTLKEDDLVDNCKFYVDTEVI